jgi:hypothetical protein
MVWDPVAVREMFSTGGKYSSFHTAAMRYCVTGVFAHQGRGAELLLVIGVCFAPQVPDSRALSAIPEHNIMLAGDRHGAIKIFSWKAQ